MNELESFDRLASLARKDHPPRLDVSARVLRAIRDEQPVAAMDWSMLIFSGVSLAAASVVVALVVDACLPLADPLAGLFPWTTVLP
jgi:hypothetical protein